MEEKLQSIGLSILEIKIYLYLLEFGISSPPAISKGTLIARPNCYDVLRKLIEKNLVECFKNGARKTYGAKDPLALAEYEEKRLKKINEAIPELRLLYDSKNNKPDIEFLDGFSQVKQIWNRSLSSSHIRGITSTKNLYKNSPQFFNTYHKELRKREILLQDILTIDSKGNVTDWGTETIGPLYEVRFLPKKYLTLPTDILIWDDNVALIHITHPVSATIISESNMADMFKIMFDLSWKQLS